MPELPEVETVCRGLNELTQGQVFQGGEVLLKRSIAHPVSIEAFWSGLKNTKIQQWQRRGKYLLAELSSGGWLGLHLRMSGQLLWVEQSEPLAKHTRVRFFFSEGKELRFIDLRTFGRVWWVAPDVDLKTVITGLNNLGVEPFSPEFTPTYLGNKLKNRRCAIKTALLDQKVVAGIGNIYADETLFLGKISPLREAASLTSSEVEALQQAIISVLSTAIEEGGTTFNSFLNLLGVNGNYMGRAWVYGREGEVCRECETVIQRCKINGRSSHFCPRCQDVR
ncbi:DNA-formamidopyrimidine glycosylase [Dactylococcopsis salina]|uniref:Formamidopyrimidine-DNA glycosylase n=1 Tax=Dactylococcopsis salina (strain PCC 8305) TaxID=13035 RepID=K9YU08_DACS8|nr:DNA-formamidopyrimidine glycosylase [Dactylococcopsis salina]AFZ49825.1 formamidopyrimidine-DNA glycosylase Fpg [Dactylococcopsis salina PCC 8305]